MALVGLLALMDLVALVGLRVLGAVFAFPPNKTVSFIEQLYCLTVASTWLCQLVQLCFMTNPKFATRWMQGYDLNSSHFEISRNIKACKN